jgi:serine/threonine-protein kinase
VGRRLFAGKNDLETLGNVLQKPVPPPSTLRPGIPPELDRIVLRALERTRELRYATADEMARDCDAVLASSRADSQSLRGFLNDLFAEESSSMSFDAIDIPEELFGASGSVSMPSSDGVPRDSSMEIQVADSPDSGGRARTPAPPFGVIAADVAAVPGDSPWRAGLTRHRSWVAGAVLVVSLLAGLGLAAQTRRASRPAAPPPAATAPVPRPRPIEAPAPPAIQAPVAAPSAAPPGTTPQPEERPAARAHRSRHARGLSADLTLNPF